jgi:hypothetical protein
MNFDGSKRLEGAGAGVILYHLKATITTKRPLLQQHNYLYLNADIGVANAFTNG